MSLVICLRTTVRSCSKFLLRKGLELESSVALVLS